MKTVKFEFSKGPSFIAPLYIYGMHTHTHLGIIDGPELMKLEVLHIPISCLCHSIIVLVTNNMVNAVKSDMGPATKAI